MENLGDALRQRPQKITHGRFLLANYNDLRNYRISINDVTVDLFEGSALVTENHMSLNLYADQDEISIVDLSLFISGDLLPHPMGVYYGLFCIDLVNFLVLRSHF